VRTRKENKNISAGWTRRAFLGAAVTAGAGALFGPLIFNKMKARRVRSETFIGHVPNYSAEIGKAIHTGLWEIGLLPEEVEGKRILLKPNLVETYKVSEHINTHPAVLKGAIETFLAYGAAEVFLAEGPGHCRDSLLLLEESGVAEALAEDRIRFIDLNYDDVYSVLNSGGRSPLKSLFFPETLQGADLIVSVAKMKTHHWAGVTLSMKNLFGVMPGSLYGWPKNVLHWAGIHKTILDIYATLKPHLTIVDGIVGMEGDGPIMGDPCSARVLVMGRNMPAVDATCARIMGINPWKIPHLAKADGWLGTIRESNIQQRGETLKSVQMNFEPPPKMTPAFKIACGQSACPAPYL
jgi:uncharacterized protein (DUF362 family)